MAGERVRIAILPDEIINKNTDRLNYGQTREYSRAVLNAGGLPSMLACTDIPEEVRAYYDAYDGFILSGGLDMNPPEGEETLATDNPGSQENDNMARQVLEHALWSPNPKPVLAICRGMQIMNVVLGGTLHRHLPDLVGDIDHREWHEVTIEDDTVLSLATGGVGRILVNSRHHQAINVLGNDLKVSARADDGVIEAVEYANKDRFVVGTQYHDEELEAPTLFVPFIRAAARTKAGQHLRLAA